MGLGAAWAAACLSAALLWWAQAKPFPTFWRASAAGLAVRGAGLAGLMVWAWKWSLEEAAALLVSYAGAVVVLLVLEVVRSRT
ncbi:MAG: hypothetical protein A2X36_08900 [Elusimicrobia bacterium GWA2_69_24]|nr:MAG: hypothetical protein A2X36_08900 [Elusimicrobia bacterium GWA2_69_24]HBL18059.1 hypothetical protein [Elusimicrobiota bacterium]